MSFDNTIRTYGDNAANLVAIFSITSPLIITVCTWIVFSLLIGTQCYSHTRQQDKTMDNMDNSTLLMRLQRCITNVRHSPNSHYTKDKKAAIVSSVVIGFVRLLLIVALDCSATFYTLNLFEIKLEKIHHNRDSAHRILYSTPFFLLAYDATCLIVYAISVVTVCAKIINFDGKTFYYYLTLTLSVPIASILLHLPYIATAYLNDANYAGSVLILYTVVTFLEFIVLQFIFIQWFNLKPADDDSKPEDSSQENQKPVHGQNASPSPGHEPSSAKEAKSVTQGSQCHSPNLSRYCHLVSFTVIVFFSLFFLYWIIGISVCFFYYLPINHSISSTSNQIIIIYQTGLIFVGAIVAYKTFFKRRNLFVKALDDCEKEIVKDFLLTKDEKSGWGKNTDQEKLTIFYRYIIKYAIDKFTES